MSDERGKTTLDYAARAAPGSARGRRPFVVAVKLGVSVILLSVVVWLTYWLFATGHRPWGAALILALTAWMVWTSARELFGGGPG